MSKLMCAETRVNLSVETFSISEEEEEEEEKKKKKITVAC